MAIYLKIPGIVGSVTTEGYDDWIEVGSLNWSVDRILDTSAGGLKDRSSQIAEIAEITLTKKMDEASLPLFNEACAGVEKEDVEIHFCKSGDPIEPYVEIDLDGCMVSNYIISSDGDRPSEVFNLNFSKISIKYIPYNEDGTPGEAMESNFNVATSKLNE